MQRAAATLVALGAVLAVAFAAPDPASARPRKSSGKLAKRTPEQRAADRHFKSGVALFKEAKYAEALAELERAYAIAPHPRVLYNIAGCHRELAHDGDAVAYYRRFLVDGPSRVSAARLATAQVELDGILARIARVTVVVVPALDGATLSIDDAPPDARPMPLILPPGEHRLRAQAPGRLDVERHVSVAPGDDVTVELVLGVPPAPPPPPPPPPAEVVERRPVAPPRAPRRFALGGGVGTDLRRTSDGGAPAIGVTATFGARLEVGADAVLVAYAFVPWLGVRVIGDALSLHVVAAMPIAVPDNEMSSAFAAGAVGLGVRFRPTPHLAFRLDSYASFAGPAHGTTMPTLLRGELWF